MTIPHTALIIEDNADMRETMRALAENAFPGIRVQDAENLEQARAYLDQSDHLDSGFLALVDLGLPDGCGTELIRGISLQNPDALCVVLSIYDDDSHLFDALSAGAAGYLLKSEPPTVLADCLLRIQRGEPPLSPVLARRILAHFKAEDTQTSKGNTPAQNEAPHLSDREQQVLGMLGLGMRTSEIARSLSLSEHTIGDHIKSIYRKLDISSRAEAAVHAVRRGLV